MSQDLLKLAIIFLVIIFFTWRKKGLDIAMLGGTITAILLYLIAPVDIARVSFKALISSATLEMIASFYLITFVQRILQRRGRLIQAEESVSRLFRSKRVNAMLIPFVIGFLPSAGAVLLAAPIVRNAAGDSLDSKEQAFVASYYRHIAESFMPTYTSILLALQLSGLSMSRYIIAMTPLVVLLFVLGYVFYVRKIEQEILPGTDSKGLAIREFFHGLWPIILTVLIIVIFELRVSFSVLIVIFLQLLIERVKLSEIKQLAISAIEPRVLTMIAIVMVFKDLLEFTGAIARIAAGVGALTLSPVIVFSLIFFLASLMLGSSGTIAVFIPMAFAAVPGAGIPLLILLMSVAYIASQVAPTHICLGIVVNEFKVSLADLIAKTMPILILFLILTAGYYQLIKLIF